MKNKALYFLFLILVGCNTTRFSIANKAVSIKSNIKESVYLQKDGFKQSEGGITFEESKSLFVNFKDKDFKKNNFIISFSTNTDSKNISLLPTFDSVLKLNSFITDDYNIEVYNVTSQIPHFKQYQEKFKYILIKQNKEDILIVLENISNFEDEVSAEFLLKKLKELEICIK